MVSFTLQTHFKYSRGTSEVHFPPKWGGSNFFFSGLAAGLTTQPLVAGLNIGAPLGRALVQRLWAFRESNSDIVTGRWSVTNSGVPGATLAYEAMAGNSASGILHHRGDLY